jgi:hypothetical protein
MLHNLSFAGLVGLWLATWGATECFAQAGARPLFRPPRTRYPLQYGLRVTQVLPGSPADLQGIEPGDVIVSVNGNALRSIQDLNYWLGESVQVAVLEVVDVRSGRWNLITVNPQAGRIGVMGVPAPVDPTGRWLPPLIPRDWGARPLPLPQPWIPPLGPWDGGVRPLPLPIPPGPAVPLPGR